MGRKALFDRAAVAALLAKQHGVITRSQLTNRAMSDAALRHRIRTGGPWRVLLPGVYLSCTGTPTLAQREIAALLYAGPGSVITGPAGLVFHRIRAPETGLIDVLVPAARRRRDAGFVRLHRTSMMPTMVFPVGPVRYVPPARAVADTVRGLTDLPDVRAVVADAVQRRKVQVWHLAEELAHGQAQGTARLRLVLAEVADGIRSAAEGDLRALIKRERLPDPLYNPRLFAGQTFIAVPDAWWPDACVAVEVDSREWHLSPRDWERTLARDARISAYGIVVLRISPRRLRTEPSKVAAEIRSVLAARRSCAAPGIRALPAA
jgi:very-short-patch-repair endonuclease